MNKQHQSEPIADSHDAVLAIGKFIVKERRSEARKTISVRDILNALVAEGLVKQPLPRTLQIIGAECKTGNT